VGSHAVNGVAQLHSELLKKTVLRSTLPSWSPRSSTNVTNGVTPRRFLVLANPGLTALITDVIGDKWQDDLNHLRGPFEHLCDDEEFCERWRQVKADQQASPSELCAARARHRALAGHEFDVQVKRIHE